MRTRTHSPRGSIATLTCIGIAMLAMVVACGDGDLTTGSTDFTAGQYGPASAASAAGHELGATSPVRFATTVVPPPPPGPSPGPTPAPGDGKVRIHGILLGFDTTCPGCTLVTRRGTVFVPDDAELFGSTADDEFPITFDELNAALQPGLPLRITADADEGATPIADNVRVEHFFATTGTIVESSSEVLSNRAFTLGVFDSALGHIEIPYVLTDDALVEPFDAFDRVYLFGVVKDGALKVRFVRRDE